MENCTKTWGYAIGIFSLLCFLQFGTLLSSENWSITLQQDKTTLSFGELSRATVECSYPSDYTADLASFFALQDEQNLGDFQILSHEVTTPSAKASQTNHLQIVFTLKPEREGLL